MRDAKTVIDESFLEMRWRCLCLAADMDRIERAAGGADAVAGDPRVKQLQDCMRIVMEGSRNRAQQVEMLLSDTTPPPGR